jgi:ribose/xylose/arabinose/galactoside ABC-type transport system permease subunit
LTYSLILAVLGNGMQLSGWGVYDQCIVKGIILIGAVAFDEIQKHSQIRKSKKIDGQLPKQEKKEKTGM